MARIFFTRISDKRSKMGTEALFSSRFFLTLAVLSVFGMSSSCSVFATRPTQEMSDTTAAIRAAKEVQADTLAPELYRQATEWFFKARKEYNFKNFQLAQDYALKARHFAENAEFEALRNGGNRSDVAPPDQAAQGQNPEPAPSPYAYPTPEGTPADVYDQRKADDDARKAREEELAAKKAEANPTPTATQPAILQEPTILVPGAGTGTTGTTPTTR
jgi:hypothetical protein